MTFDRDYTAQRVWDSGRQRPRRGRSSNTVPLEKPLRRFRPATGTKLTMEAIRGPWRPSGTVAGAGVFALVWSTRTTDFWAPLRDFAPPDQLRLIEAGGWRECGL